MIYASVDDFFGFLLFIFFMFVLPALRKEKLEEPKKKPIKRINKKRALSDSLEGFFQEGEGSTPFPSKDSSKPPHRSPRNVLRSTMRSSQSLNVPKKSVGKFSSNLDAMQDISNLTHRHLDSRVSPDLKRPLVSKHIDVLGYQNAYRIRQKQEDYSKIYKMIPKASSLKQAILLKEVLAPAKAMRDVDDLL